MYRRHPFYLGGVACARSGLLPAARKLSSCARARVHDCRQAGAEANGFLGRGLRTRRWQRAARAVGITVIPNGRLPGRFGRRRRARRFLPALRCHLRAQTARPLVGGIEKSRGRSSPSTCGAFYTHAALCRCHHFLLDGRGAPRIAFASCALCLTPVPLPEFP